MAIENFLYYISIFSVLVPLVTGIIIYKKLDVNSRLMLLLLTFASVAQLASFLPNVNDVYAFFNIYSVIDSIVWGYLFYRNSRNKWIKNTIIMIISLQVLISISTFIHAGVRNRFFTEFVCLNSLLQVLWVLSFFYERYKREEILALEKRPMFWFCLGILIYAPATYFRFAFYQRLEETDYGLKSLHHLLNTGMYLTFTVGILANVISTSKFRNVFIRYRS